MKMKWPLGTRALRTHTHTHSRAPLLLRWTGWVAGSYDSCFFYSGISCLFFILKNPTNASINVSPVWLNLHGLSVVVCIIFNRSVSLFKKRVDATNNDKICQHRSKQSEHKCRCAECQLIFVWNCFLKFEMHSESESVPEFRIIVENNYL